MLVGDTGACAGMSTAPPARYHADAASSLSRHMLVSTESTAATNTAPAQMQALLSILVCSSGQPLSDDVVDVSVGG